MKKIITILFLSLFAHTLFAQVLEVNGSIVIDNASTSGSRIVIYRNDEKIDEKVIDKRGNFTLRFPLDADYRLSFEKEGYISKIVSINTEVPEEIVEANPNFPPIKIIINLLPLVYDVDLTLFEQPVAVLTYNYELDDFSFDKDYAGRVKDRIAKTEQEIRRILSQKGSEVLAKEKMFQDLLAKGEDNFLAQKWQAAIENWNKALTIKPAEKSVGERIATAREAIAREEEAKRMAQQQLVAYIAAVRSGDSLFQLKAYNDAKLKYTTAMGIDNKKKYPADKIIEIDNLLAQLAKDEQDATAKKLLMDNYNRIISAADLAFTQKNYAEAQHKYKEALDLNYEKDYPNQQLKTIEEIIKKDNALANNYNQKIQEGDNHFHIKNYEAAIVSYNSALLLKPGEAYPKEMIHKAQSALADIKQKEQEETARRLLEEQRESELMERYRKIITEADAAFKNQNYNIARSFYMEADQLNTGEKYPGERIEEINKVINSAKYKQQVNDFNHNVELAEKAMKDKNYAGAKVYYQKAISILPIDKDKITGKIEEIDQLIAAEHQAAIEKEYNEHIKKADDAYQDKAYAIAKFYYQKALEVKKRDAYATKQLEEVEKHISERTEKTMEL